MIFVSYSWNKKNPDENVLKFVNNLRKLGFDARCDVMFTQKETAASFPQMMAENLARAEKVILVLTETYRYKADTFLGGVGDEYRYIISDITKKRHKYILVSFTEERENIMPQFLRGREVVFIDLKKEIPDKLLLKLNNKPEYVFDEVNPIQRAVIPQAVANMNTGGSSCPEISAVMSKDFNAIELFIKSSTLGIDHAKYQWDVESKSTKFYSTYLQISIPKQKGERILYVYAVDKNGNYSQGSVENHWVEFKINFHKPLISIDPVERENVKKVTLRIKTETGLDHGKYQWNAGGSATKFTDDIVEIDVPRYPGTQILYVYAVDNRGNYSCGEINEHWNKFIFINTGGA